MLSEADKEWLQKRTKALSSDYNLGAVQLLSKLASEIQEPGAGKDIATRLLPSEKDCLKQQLKAAINVDDYLGINVLARLGANIHQSGTGVFNIRSPSKACHMASGSI